MQHVNFVVSSSTTKSCSFKTTSCLRLANDSSFYFPLLFSKSGFTVSLFFQPLILSFHAFHGFRSIFYQVGSSLPLVWLKREVLHIHWPKINLFWQKLQLSWITAMCPWWRKLHRLCYDCTLCNQKLKALCHR